MSEIITPELHNEEYNDLLYEMRSLLYGVRQNDTIDNFTVSGHTDTRTVMQTGDPRDSVIHLVFEDTHQGILARNLRSQPTPDGMGVIDNTIILSDPLTSRMFSEVRPTMSKTMFNPMHDINQILDQMQSSSKPLTKEMTEHWYSHIHELWEHMPKNTRQIESKLPPQNSPPFRRLFKRHVSRV